MWPDHGRAIRRPVPVLALVAGLVAAVLVPDATPGLGILLTGLAIGAPRCPRVRTGSGVHEVGFAALGVALLAAVAVRDAPWFVALCLLGAAGVASFALAPARTLVGGLLGGVSLPLAAPRCLPWLNRGLRRHATGAAGSWLAVAADHGALTARAAAGLRVPVRGRRRGVRLAGPASSTSGCCRSGS